MKRFWATKKTVFTKWKTALVGEMLKWRRIVPTSSQYIVFRKGKGLFSYENKPFLHPFGGDKRDRTADLLNAIY